MTAGPSMRLFVAIELSPEWLLALGEAQETLRTALRERPGTRLRYVRPEGVHLTLKFLGAVPESRLQSVGEALGRAAERLTEFKLVMSSRAGFFGDRRRPRVLWAGVDGASPVDRDALYRLAEGIETWLATAGFPRERRFRPHLTLARLPEEMKDDERAMVAEAATALVLASPAPLEVRSFSLIRSHLGPGGARYERLRSFPAENIAPA